MNIAEYLGSEEKEIKLYHENGELALWYFKNSDGYWIERTYDKNGNKSTFKDLNGFWTERTYDENGFLKTFKDSNGVFIDFTAKEITKKQEEKEYRNKIVE